MSRKNVFKSFSTSARTGGAIGSRAKTRSQNARRVKRTRRPSCARDQPAAWLGQRAHLRGQVAPPQQPQAEDEVTGYVYRPGEAEPLRLSRHSAALRLLQYVRDEAHRFAQHYHKILRRKRLQGE